MAATGATQPFLSTVPGCLLLLLAYTLFGASVFYVTENIHIETNTWRAQVTRDDLVDSLWRVTRMERILPGPNQQRVVGWAPENYWKLRATHLLQDFEEKLHQRLLDGYEPSGAPSDKPEPPHDPRWSFSAAMYYAVTVYTTIGYGNLFPRSNFGKLFTIVYATLGIPLALICLSTLGRALTRAVKLLLCSVEGKKDNEKSINEDFNFGLGFSIALLAAYAGFGAVIYKLNNPEWELQDSFYFVFVSLSTIGFGDMVPEEHGFFLFTSLYLLLGLALASLVTEAIQKDLEHVLGISSAEPLLESEPQTGRKNTSEQFTCNSYSAQDALQRAVEESNAKIPEAFEMEFPPYDPDLAVYPNPNAVQCDLVEDIVISEHSSKVSSGVNTSSRLISDIENAWIPAGLDVEYPECEWNFTDFKDDIVQESVMTKESVKQAYQQPVSTSTSEPAPNYCNGARIPEVFEIKYPEYDPSLCVVPESLLVKSEEPKVESVAYDAQVRAKLPSALEADYPAYDPSLSVVPEILSQPKEVKLPEPTIYRGPTHHCDREVKPPAALVIEYPPYDPALATFVPMERATAVEEREEPNLTNKKIYIPKALTFVYPREELLPKQEHKGSMAHFSEKSPENHDSSGVEPSIVSSCMSGADEKTQSVDEPNLDEAVNHNQSTSEENSTVQTIKPLRLKIGGIGNGDSGIVIEDELLSSESANTEASPTFSTITDYSSREDEPADATGTDNKQITVELPVYLAHDKSPSTQNKPNTSSVHKNTDFQTEAILTRREKTPERVITKREFTPERVMTKSQVNSEESITKSKVNSERAMTQGVITPERASTREIVPEIECTSESVSAEFTINVAPTFKPPPVDEKPKSASNAQTTDSNNLNSVRPVTLHVESYEHSHVTSPTPQESHVTGHDNQGKDTNRTQSSPRVKLKAETPTEEPTLTTSSSLQDRASPAEQKSSYLDNTKPPYRRLRTPDREASPTSEVTVQSPVRDRVYSSRLSPASSAAPTSERPSPPESHSLSSVDAALEQARQRRQRYSPNKRDIDTSSRPNTGRLSTASSSSSRGSYSPRSPASPASPSSAVSMSRFVYASDPDSSRRDRPTFNNNEVKNSLSSRMARFQRP